MKRKKTYIIIFSLIIAFFVMSGGYGFWEEYLTIKGRITVKEPPKKDVIAGLENSSSSASDDISGKDSTDNSVDNIGLGNNEGANNSEEENDQPNEEPDDNNSCLDTVN